LVINKNYTEAHGQRNIEKCSFNMQCSWCETFCWPTITPISCRHCWRIWFKIGRDIVKGNATRYRLDGSGIESYGKRDFPHPCRPALGPTQPPLQRESDLFTGRKATE